MIEIANIRIPLESAGTSEADEREMLMGQLEHSYDLTQAELSGLEYVKRSIDARKRRQIKLVYSVRLTLADTKERELINRGSARAIQAQQFGWPKVSRRRPHQQIVVVGAGCAGLFCALTLARAGLAPVLIERGDNAERRSAAVKQHNTTGTLDCESNIQFGLGGAGTFSDGKLATGTRSHLHRPILEELVACGAKSDILWSSHPHVGSDVLPSVVTELVHHIEAAGGSVLFRHRMTGLELRDKRLIGITVEHEGHEERIACSQLVLATGHSARDVYALLKGHNIALERKPFAMGVRIEHLQADVDKACYGFYAGHPLLGAAPYKCAIHLPHGRSAFSFCMCPGGSVVSAASEEGCVCTNGASESARDGRNANAGFLVGINPCDLAGSDVLAGIELQRSCERAAFAAGGGSFIAPAQLLGDFLGDIPSRGAGAVTPSYPRGVRWTRLNDCLPPQVINTLRAAIPQAQRRLSFFSHFDAVLTGVETRSSSPVRIVRDTEGQSTSTVGLWPVGEGAGYAGGIMSAATDGMRCALALIELLSY